MGYPTTASFKHLGFLKEVYAICLLPDIETLAFHFLSLFHKEGIAFPF